MEFDASRFQAALTTRTLGRFLEYRPSVDTTMRLARRAADEGAAHGTLVLADEQTAGRGRQGRSFVSPAGHNLYFTLVLRGTAASLRYLSLAVPVAVCSAIREEDVDARVKWPNDVWIEGLKVSGMLIDAEGSGDVMTAFPGIGINVRTDFSHIADLAPIAISLETVLGRPVDRETLLARVCNDLEGSLLMAPHLLLERYRALSLVVGQPVEVTFRDGTAFAGVAEDIDHDGGLRVRRGSRLEVVHAADVSLRPIGWLDPSR